MVARRRKVVPKMGRPAGPEENLRRNRVVAMLTDAEYEALERLAGEQEVPLGTALHRLVRRALRVK